MAEGKLPPSPALPPRHWHDGARAGSPSQPSSQRKKKTFHLLIVLMALLGIFFAWLLFWNPVDPPKFLAFPITQYKHWPMNAWAQQDGKALALLLDPDPEKKFLFQAQQRSLLIRHLQDLEEQFHREKKVDPKRAVVVYLCALARTDDRGDVYLLPADADAGLPDSWIPFQQIVGWLNACKAENKLLLLDLMRPNTDPRLGILTNDVAERVQAVLTRQDLSFAVLGPCSPGQVSWASEEMGQSVFGYYLAEGLNGWADIYNAKTQKDDRVSVRELAEFVKSRVSRWAIQRDLQQTPFFISGRPEDFVLARSQRSPKSAGSRAFSHHLKTGWEEWQKGLKEKNFRREPLALKKLEDAVLEAEKRWRSGMAEDQEMGINNAIQLIQTPKIAGKIPSGPKVHSLALAGKDKPLGPEHPQIQAIVKLLETAMKIPVPRLAPGSSDLKNPDKESVEARQNFLTQFQTSDATDLARAIWEVAVSDDVQSQPGIRAALLFDWYQAWCQARKVDALKWVEIIFLKQLKDLKPDSTGISPSTIRNCLGMVRLAESVVADPRVFPFLRPWLDSARKKRDDAERALWKTPLASDQVADLVNQAFKEYQDLAMMEKIVEQALLTRDEALFRLPPYASYLMKRLEFDSLREGMETWLEATRELDFLDGDLASLEAENQPGVKQNLIEKIGERVKRLRRLMDELQQPLHWKNLLDLAKESPANLKEWDALFELPWWQIPIRMKDLGPEEKHQLETRFGLNMPEKPKPGEEFLVLERDQLWEKWQQRGRKLNREKVWNLDSEENLSGKKTPEPERGNEKQALQAERDRALARAEISIGLLRLGGYPETEKLEQERKKSAAGKESSLAKDLYQAWHQKLEKELQRTWNSKEFARADRLSRIVPAWIHNCPWDAEKFRKTPWGEKRLEELRQFWKWHSEVCRKRSEVLQETRTPFAEFYKNAAREYEKKLP